jgi:large repetitive protein
MNSFFNKYCVTLLFLFLPLYSVSAQESYVTLTVSNKSYPDASAGGDLVGSNVKIDGTDVSQQLNDQRDSGTNSFNSFNDLDETISVNKGMDYNVEESPFKPSIRGIKGRKCFNQPFWVKLDPNSPYNSGSVYDWQYGLVTDDLVDNLEFTGYINSIAYDLYDQCQQSGGTDCNSIFSLIVHSNYEFMKSGLYMYDNLPNSKEDIALSLFIGVMRQGGYYLPDAAFLNNYFKSTIIARPDCPVPYLHDISVKNWKPLESGKQATDSVKFDAKSRPTELAELTDRAQFGFRVKSINAGNGESGPWSDESRFDLLPSPPIAGSIKTDPSCVEKITGAINITGIAGPVNTSLFTYKIIDAINSCDDLSDNSTDIDGYSIIKATTSGSYKLCLSYSNTSITGCISDQEFSVSSLPELDYRVSKQDVSCPGGSDGSIRIEILKRAGDFTSMVDDLSVCNESDHEFTGLSSKSYKVSVSDFCKILGPVDYTIKQPEAITISIMARNPTCISSPNGGFEVQASGISNAQYDYYLYKVGDYPSGPSVLNAVKQGPTWSDYSLPGGSYIINVRDSQHPGCPGAVSSFSLNPVTPLDLRIDNVYNVKCYGGNSGEIDVSATGGSEIYKFDIGGDIVTTNTAKFKSLQALSYTVAVRNHYLSCADVASKVVTVGTNPPIEINLTPKDANCYDNSDGQINTVVTGGSGSYSSYDWQQKVEEEWYWYPADGASPTNFYAGEYRVKVTDSEQCFAFATSLVKQPPLLYLSNATSTDVKCFGGLGQIWIDAMGGNGGNSFFYSVNDWVSSSVIGSGSEFSAGTYSLKVRDSKGCESKKGIDGNEIEVSITEPSEQLNFSTVLKDYNGYNISGYGLSDGTITVNVTGGNGERGSGGNYEGYTYSISGRGVQTNGIFTSLDARQYNITVSDDRGCALTRPITLTQPEILIPSASSVKNVKCFGAATGEITLSATGGVGPYTYQKNSSGFGPSPYFTGLIAGTYLFHVKDRNNIEKDISVTVIDENAKISSILLRQDVLCFGEGNGQIAATITGGSGGYNTVWQKLVGGVWQTKTTGTFSINNLDPGKYRLKITDSENCSAYDSALINQPALLSISGVVPHDIVCFGNTGNIDISAIGGKGGYQYFSTLNEGATYSQFTSISPLSAASYKVKVMDSNGCEAKWNNYVIITGPDDVLDFTTGLSDYNGFNISCYGRSDGSITVNPSGGNGSGYSGYNYSFEGAPPNQTSVYNNLTAGTYNIKVSDGRGCQVIKPVTLTQSLIPVNILASKHLDTKCFNDSSGVINLSASGGAPPYEYMIGEGSYVTSNEFSRLPTGNYLFTVKDKNGCTNTLSSVITSIYPKPAIALLTQDIKCYQKNDGSVQSSLSGGSGSFGLKWFMRSDSNWQYIKSDSTLITALTPGEYRIQATDLAGCPAIYDSTTVYHNVTPLVISNVTLNDVVCYSGSGSIDIQASGSNGGYIYQYSQNNQSYVNYSPGASLPSAEYGLRVLDSKGCTTSWPQKVVITHPDKPLDFTWAAKDFNGSDVSCFGKNDGVLTVKPEGGNGAGYKGYKYLLSGRSEQTDSLFSNLSAGAYNLSITDGRGCTITRSVSLKQPSAQLGLVVSELKDTKCFNDSSGVITIEASGGIFPYTYKIGQENFVSATRFEKLPVGDYYFTVKDKNGCTSGISSTISNIYPKPLIKLIPQEISCYQKSDGSIQSELRGGSGNFALKWFMKTGSLWDYFKSDSSTITRLSPGDYRIQITDLAGCPAFYDSTSVIQRVTPLVISRLILQDVICFGDSGSVDIHAAGGNGGYVYQYSQNNSSYSTYTPGAPLPYSEYRIKVNDVKGCETLWPENLIITHPDKPLDVTWVAKDYAGYNVSCFGNNDGRMIVTPTGGNGSGYKGYSFLLSGRALQTDTLFEKLYAGDYTLKVTDDRGCTINKRIAITQAASKLGLWPTRIKMATCIEGSDGSITLAASGGVLPYTYSAGGDEFVSERELGNLKVRPYRFTVRDVNGCTQIFDTSIINIVTKMDIAGIISDANCLGQNSGKISVSISGGAKPFSYQWRDFPITGPNIGNLIKGDYKLTVTDSAGCVADTIFNIKEPLQPLIINSVKLNDIICYGDSGSIQIEASGSNGGYTYQYSRNSDPLENYIPGNPLPFGSYRMRVKDLKGCETEWPENVTITRPPHALGLAWKAKDYNGFNVLCFDDSNGQLVVKPYGGNGDGYQGYSYLMSGRSLQTDTVFSDLKAGSYYVKVTDERGCSVIEPISIIQPPAPVGLMVSKLTNTKCFNDSTGIIKLTASGGVQPYEYMVGKGNFAAFSEFNKLPTGKYHFMVKDRNGCLDSLNQTVGNIYPKPSITLIPQDIRCYQKNDGQVQVSLTGGSGSFGLNWFKKSGNKWQYIRSDSSRITALLPGDYRVEVTDQANCPSLYDSTTIYQKVTPLNLTATSQPACVQLSNGSIFSVAAGGTPPYLYSVDQLKMQTDPSFQVYSGLHRTYTADAFNCRAEATIQVGERNTMPLVNFMVATNRYELDTLVIKDVSVPGPDRVLWAFSPEATVISTSTLETRVKYNMAGIYPVKMTGYFGTCEYSLEKLINIAPFDPLVIPKDRLQTGIEKVQISPNPNNGQFRIKVKLYNKQQIQIRVLDYYSKIHFSARYPETVELVQELSIQGALPGSYVLWVITDNDYKAVIFIISQ